MAPRRSGRTPKPTAKYAAFKSASKRKPKTPVPTKALTQAITRVVKGKMETKLAIAPPMEYAGQTTLAAFVPFTCAITAPGEFYMLIPPVTQGVGDNQRIGNTILPQSLITKVNCCVTSRQESTVSIYAHFFFMTHKSLKDWKQTSSIVAANLLDNGDGTNTGFDGTSYHAMLPINKTEFNLIAHKKILLQKGANNPNVAYAPTETNATDTFKYFASFSQKIPLPKKLQYLVAGDPRPTNSFPMMCCAFTATDQQGTTILSAQQLRVQAQSHLYYKDA